MRFNQEILLFSQEKFAYEKLLFKWKNSLWRLILKDIIILWVCYMSLSACYYYYIVRYPAKREYFEQFISILMAIDMSNPISILLGFFISAVLSRYWSYIESFPNESSTSFYINSIIKSWGKAKDSKLVHYLKRVIIRHICLAWLIHMIQHSYELKIKFCYRKKVFKSLYDRLKSVMFRDEFTKSTIFQIFENINSDPFIQKYMGVLITKEEIKIYRQRQIDSKWWLPIKWVNYTLNSALKHNFTRSDESFSEILGSIEGFRNDLEFIERVDYFSIPKIYLQMVAIIVHFYFVVEIFSIQLSDKPGYEDISFFNAVHTFFPIVPLFKFILYMGWFRMGLNMSTPLEENHSGFNTMEFFKDLITITTYMNVSREEESPRVLTEKCRNFKEEMEKQFYNALSEAKNIAWIFKTDTSIWPTVVDWNNLINPFIKNGISDFINEKESFLFNLKKEKVKYKKLHQED